MPDQADRLRELIAATRPPEVVGLQGAPTLAVTGGKGGVGTTTVALNLAVALSQRGWRTVLVDGAPQADLAHLAGVAEPGGPCLEDVLAGIWRVGEALADGPCGVKVLAGRAMPLESAKRSQHEAHRLLGILSTLGEQIDAIVIDTGSGMTPWTRTIWHGARQALLVSTPQDSAVLDAYATIKLSGGDGPPVDVRLLVNLCDDAARADEVRGRIAAACRRFLGRAVSRAPRLPTHEANGGPVEPLCGWKVPGTAFGRSVDQLGRLVAELLSHHRPAAAGQTTPFHSAPDYLPGCKV